MLQIVKIENDERSKKLIYEFQTKNNPYWKKFYVLSCIISGKEPLIQGTMSDYEFFKKINLEKKTPNKLPSTEFYLLEGLQPVTSINIIMRSPNIADITFITIPEKRRQGYAKTAVTMIEKILFDDPNILFTTITDITEAKISTHIALSLDYIYEEETNTFVKPNPKFTIEDMKEQIRLKHL